MKLLSTYWTEVKVLFFTLSDPQSKYKVQSFCSLAHVAHSYLSTMTHNKIIRIEKSISIKVLKSVVNR